MAKQYKVKTCISYCYLVFSSVFFKNCFSKYKIMLKIKKNKKKIKKIRMVYLGRSKVETSILIHSYFGP